ncbi:MAG: Zn-dependent hydrolase [halophilic archaeon J07HX64]|jgi:Zn-dependent hydrolases, including glyoxylases|nr:MAG: Zn-dependent hydrolase [halophilic archaeon J07HX64]
MEFPSPPAEVDSVSPSELRRRIDNGERVTLLDTRLPEAHEAWQISGDTVTTLNAPYPAFRGTDVDRDVLDGIPSDRLVTAVCAIGKSSEYVAGVLAERGYEVEHLVDGMEGWARIYDAVEVSRYDGPGRVWQYVRPSSGCLGYLVVDEGEAAVVDPLRAFATRYVTDAGERGAELSYAIDTHVHADHVSGVRRLAADGVEGVMPAPATDRGLAEPEELRLLSDDDTLRVGRVPVEAVHAPGHTSGMTALRVGGCLLLTGDGLFIESVARPDLEAGQETASAARRLHTSLCDLLALPGETLVCPGHRGETTDPASDGTYTARLDELRDRKMLSLSREAFVETLREDVPPRPANHEAIVATNLGQRHPDDAEAFELELGPNNCAAAPSDAD